MSINLSDVVDIAVTKVTGSYDLDAEFVASVKASLESTLSKYYIYNSPQNSEAVESVDGKKKSTPKKTRSKCGYNFYVAEKMKELESVPHKERMKQISSLWNEASAEVKAKYNQIAEAAKVAVTN